VIVDLIVSLDTFAICFVAFYFVRQRIETEWYAQLIDDSFWGSGEQDFYPLRAYLAEGQ